MKRFIQLTVLITLLFNVSVFGQNECEKIKQQIENKRVNGNVLVQEITKFSNDKKNIEKVQEIRTKIAKIRKEIQKLESEYKECLKEPKKDANGKVFSEEFKNVVNKNITTEQQGGSDNLSNQSVSNENVEHFVSTTPIANTEQEIKKPTAVRGEKAVPEEKIKVNTITVNPIRTNNQWQVFQFERENDTEVIITRVTEGTQKISSQPYWSLHLNSKRYAKRSFIIDGLKPYSITFQSKQFQSGNREHLTKFCTVNFIPITEQQIKTKLKSSFDGKKLEDLETITNEDFKNVELSYNFDGKYKNIKELKKVLDKTTGEQKVEVTIKAHYIQKNVEKGGLDVTIKMPFSYTSQQVNTYAECPKCKGNIIDGKCQNDDCETNNKDNKQTEDNENNSLLWYLLLIPIIGLLGFVIWWRSNKNKSKNEEEKSLYAGYKEKQTHSTTETKVSKIKDGNGEIVTQEAYNKLLSDYKELKNITNANVSTKTNAVKTDSNKDDVKNDLQRLQKVEQEYNKLRQEKQSLETQLEQAVNSRTQFSEKLKAVESRLMYPNFLYEVEREMQKVYQFLQTTEKNCDRGSVFYKIVSSALKGQTQIEGTSPVFDFVKGNDFLVQMMGVKDKTELKNIQKSDFFKKYFMSYFAVGLSNLGQLYAYSKADEVYFDMAGEMEKAGINTTQMKSVFESLQRMIQQTFEVAIIVPKLLSPFDEHKQDSVYASYLKDSFMDKLHQLPDNTIYDISRVGYSGTISGELKPKVVYKVS